MSYDDPNAAPPMDVESGLAPDASYGAYGADPSSQWEGEWSEDYQNWQYDANQHPDIEAGPEIEEEEQDKNIHEDHGENIGGFSYDAVRNGAWFTMLSGSDTGVSHFLMVSRDLTTLIVATSPPPTLTDPIEIPLNLVSEVAILGYDDPESAATIVLSMGDNELRIAGQTPEIAEEWMIVLDALSKQANEANPLNQKRKRNMRKHIADALEAPGRMHKGWKILIFLTAVLMMVAGIVMLIVFAN